jgi:hypothetical protein
MSKQRVKFTRTQERNVKLYEKYVKVLSDLGKAAPRVTRKYIFELVVEDDFYIDGETAKRIIDRMNKENKMAKIAG